MRKKKTLAKKRGPVSPVIETRHATELGHAITYERRPVLCGKTGCRKLHGPYWYAYWTQGGRVRTVYIGKKWQAASRRKPEAFT